MRLGCNVWQCASSWGCGRGATLRAMCLVCFERCVLGARLDPKVPGSRRCCSSTQRGTSGCNLKLYTVQESTKARLPSSLASLFEDLKGWLALYDARRLWWPGWWMAGKYVRGTLGRCCNTAALRRRPTCSRMFCRVLVLPVRSFHGAGTRGTRSGVKASWPCRDVHVQ